MMQEPIEIGDWKLISTLGSGSFGTVSLWRHQISLECIGKLTQLKQIKYFTKQ